ncbi:MAG: RNA polymerase sigma factor [Acidobacteria bacterium]|nr:RNA polymerase sigma factor [Acidobacteriota bacterium]
MDVYEDMSGQPVVTAMAVDAESDDRAERLAALFDAHQERLYRLARRLAQDSDDASDLVQDTFLRAARSPGSVPVGLADEEAWLVRVLINIRRDQWRKTAVRNRFSASLCVAVTSDDSNQESALIARTTVWRALDVLQPRRRAVVIMHELEGLTISSIASLLGISAITVRWHLSMGRHDLTRALKPFMGDNA